MAFEVKVPAVGESVQEGEIFKWHKNDGEYVELDEVLVELETDKATVEIVAEAAGILHHSKSEGETVAVGDLLATIDTESEKPASKGAKESKSKETGNATGKQQPPPPPTSSSDERPQSPAVARMVREEGIDTSSIEGSGRGGRLTKEDLVNHKDAASKPVASQSESSGSGIKAQTASVPPKPVSSGTGQRQVRREKMSRLRQRIAERLVEAQQTAAMLTTFNEVDMTAVMNLRKSYKEQFKEVHGVGLGFMSFFVTATVQALKAFPAINGYVDGQEIVFHDYQDIGVAVSTDRGLMVPVIRNCEDLNFAGIEAAIMDFAKRGRDGKIGVDELSGGTFTISNGGVFGSLLSTPILNPPQSAILGMHKIQERPMVINGEIKIRPMMYLALSYDHRIVDGKEAVSFLVKIKEGIEDPARLLLGV